MNGHINNSSTLTPRGGQHEGRGGAPAQGTWTYWTEWTGVEGGGSATVNVTAMILQKINMQTFAWQNFHEKRRKN